jgi:hypothetical protein
LQWKAYAVGVTWNGKRAVAEERIGRCAAQNTYIDKIIICIFLIKLSKKFGLMKKILNICGLND